MTSENILNELLSYSKLTTSPKHYMGYLKKNIIMYQYILENYPVNEKSQFPYIVHVVKNDIRETPLCLTCGKNVRWNNWEKRFNTFCSSKCSIHIAVAKAATEESKENRKQSILEKYGVENISHIPEVQNSIKKSQLKHWKSVNGITNDYSILYRRFEYRVKYYTNKEYYKRKDIIDPFDKRGRFGYHIDHIYSKHDAFKNDVPMEVICHWSNLQLIPYQENLAKNKRSDKTLEELYEDYYKNGGL